MSRQKGTLIYHGKWDSFMNILMKIYKSYLTFHMKTLLCILLLIITDKYGYKLNSKLLFIHIGLHILKLHGNFGS